MVQCVCINMKFLTETNKNFIAIMSARIEYAKKMICEWNVIDEIGVAAQTLFSQSNFLNPIWMNHFGFIIWCYFLLFRYDFDL